MEKSVNKAFTYMFEDKDWKYKLFILSALAFPGIFMGFQSENIKASFNPGAENIVAYAIYLIFLFILVLVCTFLFEGYCCRCTRQIAYLDENNIEEGMLPKWEVNFWSYAKVGLLFSIGYSLLGLAATLGAILIVPFLFAVFAYIAIKTVFCIDMKIKSFFEWKKAWKLITCNWGNYFKVIFYSIGIYILFGIVAYIATTSIELTFIGAFAQAYTYLVLAYLRGSLFPVNPDEFFATE